MNVVIDTNLWISFVIGKKLSVLRILLTNPIKIRKYITDDDVRNMFELMELFCHHVPIVKKATSSVRDPKDLYLLSLADTVSADFILTGDKDLLTLQSHNKTKIITYKEYMAIIGT